jgi:hypothetical protein
MDGKLQQLIPFLDPLEDIQVRQFLQFCHTFPIRLHHLLIVKQYPVVPNPNVRNVVPRM